MPQFVYVIRFGDVLKIGRSGDLRHRLSQHRSDTQMTVTCLGVIRCESFKSAIEQERRMLLRMRACPRPRTLECFTATARTIQDAKDALSAAGGIQECP